MTRLRQNGRKPDLSIPSLALRNVLSLANILALSWIVVLYWGERQVFHSSIRRCGWDRWEDWVRTSDVDFSDR